MHPELEALLKAWEAYQETPAGSEARRLRSVYDVTLEDFCERSRRRKEIIHRLVLHAYQRWKSSGGPQFPTMPPKA